MNTSQKKNVKRRRPSVVVLALGCIAILLFRYGKAVTSTAMYAGSLSNSNDLFYDFGKELGVVIMQGLGQKNNSNFTEAPQQNNGHPHKFEMGQALIRNNNQTNNDTTIQPDGNVTYFYTKERGDRVGAAIQEMLLGHAFARQQGAVYAGACGQKPQTVNHKRFVNHFGLNAALPFVDTCPLPNQTGHRLLQRNEFIEERNISRLFTQEWLRDMQQHIRYPPPLQNFSIAVHIRRGDVSPCHWRWGERYMPNQFYLDLIQLYLPGNQSEGVNVTIFSERHAYESFDDFAQYNLALDTDPLTVWEALFASHVVILSKSSFSLVPAWLRREKVVSGPQYHTLLPHWDAAPPHVLERTSAELKRLQGLCPKR